MTLGVTLVLVAFVLLLFATYDEVKKLREDIQTLVLSGVNESRSWELSEEDVRNLVDVILEELEKRKK